MKFCLDFISLDFKLNAWKLNNVIGDPFEIIANVKKYCMLKISIQQANKKIRSHFSKWGSESFKKPDIIK